MVYAKLMLKRTVDWSTFPTTLQCPLLLATSQRDILDSYNVQEEAPKALKKLGMTQITISTAMASTTQVDSVQQVTEGGPSSSKAVAKEVFSIPPTRLVPTQTVVPIVEQKNASSDHRVIEEGGPSS